MSLPDLFNAAGGWFESHGWRGARFLRRGETQHTDLADIWEAFPETAALIDCRGLPESWQDCDPLLLMGLLDLGPRFGHGIDPLYHGVLLIDPIVHDSIPF